MPDIVHAETHKPAPKRPSGASWVFRGVHRAGEVEAFIFDHLSGIRALSSVDYIDPPYGRGLEYHLSISAAGRRATTEQVTQALADFGLERAAEDNHIPGVARNFWLPIDTTIRPECDCAANEKPHDLGGGFVWRVERGR